MQRVDRLLIQVKRAYGVNTKQGAGAGQATRSFFKPQLGERTQYIKLALCNGCISLLQRA